MSINWAIVEMVINGGADLIIEETDDLPQYWPEPAEENNENDEVNNGKTY